MKITMVYQLNEERCAHDVAIGHSCDKCASIRGMRLVSELESTTEHVVQLNKALNKYRLKGK